MTRLLLLILLFVFCAVAPAAAQWADAVAALERSIVLLEMGDDQVDAGSCSGIVLNAEQGYVLTAAHCVPTNEDHSIVVADRDAKPEKVNRRLDLAVLKVRLRKGATNITLAPSMPRAGSAVAVLGYPFGARSLTTQVGIVANPDVEGKAWINADLLPGDSGGAIIDPQGRLVALTSGYVANGAAHMGVAAPIDTIAAFVEDYLP
jgi:S1-C subfamily serine protease